MFDSKSERGCPCLSGTYKQSGGFQVHTTSRSLQLIMSEEALSIQSLHPLSPPCILSTNKRRTFNRLILVLGISFSYFSYELVCYVTTNILSASHGAPQLLLLSFFAASPVPPPPTPPSLPSVAASSALLLGNVLRSLMASLTISVRSCGSA